MVNTGGYIWLPHVTSHLLVTGRLGYRLDIPPILDPFSASAIYLDAMEPAACTSQTPMPFRASPELPPLPLRLP